MDVVLALDLSGAQVSAGLMTFNGEVLDVSRADMVSESSRLELFDQVSDVVSGQLLRAEEHHRVTPVVIGVGLAGLVEDHGELVSPFGLTGWSHFPLRKRLAEVARLPVYIDTDAKALALAEGWLGAAQGSSNFMAIVVGETVTGGVIIDGQLLDGASGNAGNIGHVVVEPNGRRCACGGRGCLEAEASARSIEAMTGRATTSPSYDTMVRAGKLVGRGIASVCNLLDLDRVVVGGSVAVGFSATFFNAANASVAEHCQLSYSRGVRISPSRLAERGPLLGAGAVGLRGFRRTPRPRSI